MELTQEQTKKINDFLEGIGVDYIDIRYEMVDHIASEIEEKVSDTDAFFENQRFQTIFVKYMLSKKDALQKKYQKIVKRKFWTDTKKISVNAFKEGIKVKNLTFLTLLITLTYSLSLFNVKNTLIVLFILSVALYSYNGYTLHRIFKKYGHIKLVQSYTLLLGFISYIPLYIINNPFTIYSEKHFELWKLYTHTIFIYLVFLLCKVLLSQKNKINAKYQYLTE
ncbi:hypothetical protein BA195_02815 [Tenacibaculum soleae]|uniref:Uncharacterized protein n=1 Tax=Tenacibaculum soleae TaxID=447689 RepID=A0A1B9Y1H8_9FLAO|nr:hypothetical protein [Tenacibaculum soleae]OCK43652.1 hypothetical protein BA195_02815 [Tenacibaculum soleae]